MTGLGCADAAMLEQVKNLSSHSGVGKPTPFYKLFQLFSHF